jgi:hypothetical protein
MKTIKTVFLSLLLVIFSSCRGQSQKENVQLVPEKNNGIVVKEDTLNKPRINVRVNKQYDDKGRIVKFDSTYFYFYSSPEKSLQLGNDSVYSSFRSFFEKSYPNLMSRQNNNIFFNDSLFKYDFFNDDYFQKRFELNEKMFENMYQQMDSIKREFLKHNYPNGYRKKFK